MEQQRVITDWEFDSKMDIPTDEHGDPIYSDATPIQMFIKAWLTNGKFALLPIDNYTANSMERTISYDGDVTSELMRIANRNNCKLADHFYAER